MQTGGLDPHITSAYNSATATGTLSAEDEAWFRDRGPGDKTIRRIKAPTLLVGGTVDTLFPLDEDVKVYRLLKARGTPVKMFWFCGGHGQCAEGNGGETGAGLDVGSIIGSGGGDPRLEAASAAWLARYLKGDRSVEDRPRGRVPLGRRNYRVAPQYPVAPGKPVKARGSGTLSITPGATSGGQAWHGGRRAAASTCRSRAEAAQLLGPPKVTITYRGTGAPAGARVFAQLINLDRGVVVGNQSTPIPVRLDGRKHTISRRLVPITSTAPAGGRYTLQLVAGTAIWASSGPRARSRHRGSRSSCRWPTPAASAAGAGGAPPTGRWPSSRPAGCAAICSAGGSSSDGARWEACAPVPGAGESASDAASRAGSVCAGAPSGRREDRHAAPDRVALRVSRLNARARPPIPMAMDRARPPAELSGERVVLVPLAEKHAEPLRVDPPPPGRGGIGGARCPTSSPGTSRNPSASPCYWTAGWRG